MPAPSLCVVSGVVYDENGVPAVGVTIYLKRVLLNGVLIGTTPIGTASIPQLAGGDHTVQYIEIITSIAGGVVSFTVPQLSTIYMEGNVSGFNNGEVALSIPATATATLESLVAASVIPATGLTVQDDGVALANLIGTLNFGTGLAVVESPTGVATVNASVVDAETIQDALVNFFPDVAPFDWTYDDAGDRVTLAILDATASARGLMSTAYAARLDQLEVGDAPTFAGLTLSGLTLGSIPFAGAGGVISQDNAKLFWDDTNDRLGLGTATPTPATLFGGANGKAMIHLFDAGAGTFVHLRLQTGSTDVGLGIDSGAFFVDVASTKEIRLRNNSTDRIRINSTGLVSVNAGASPGAQLHTLSNAIGVIPFIAEGPAGQTANLFEARVNGVVKGCTTKDGFLVVGAASSTFPLNIQFGATANDAVTVSTSGSLLGGSNALGGKYQLVVVGSSQAAVRVASDSQFGFNSATNLFSGSIDSGLARGTAAALLAPTNGTTGWGGFEFTEVADFAAGATNKARLYARDNGSGKTQLVVIFATGAVQVLATEP